MPTATDDLIAAHLDAAAEDGHNLDAPVTVTIADRKGFAYWQAPDPHRPNALETSHAEPGATVTMPTRAAIRLAALGWVAGVAPHEASRVTDLDALSAEHAADLAALEAVAERALEETTDEDLEPDPDAELSLEDALAADGITQPPSSPPTGEPTEPAELASFLEDAAEEQAPAASTLDDAELRAKSAPQLCAHLDTFPGDADRVRALEAERKPSAQRATVLERLARLDTAGE